METLKKLIIIPAYNERHNLASVILDIQRYAPTFDYIVINDCSTDDTRSLCETEGYRTVHLVQNLGIGGAVQTGYFFAKKYNYDIAVQFDGDGQHDARYLTKMAEKMIEEQADVVIGSRFIEKEGFQSTRLRQAGIHFLSGLIACIHKRKIFEVTSGLRMVNRRVIDDCCVYYPSDYPEPETLASLIRHHYRIIEVPVTMRTRQEGRSSITPVRSLYYMLKVSLAILVDAMKPKG